MNTSDLHKSQRLLHQLTGGDEAAFRQLYDLYWNRIYSTALALTQSTHVAMDVVQDTFTMLWKKRETLTEVENIEAYIYTAGRNRITSLLRNRKVFLNDDVLNSRSQQDFHSSPERQVALRQFREKILQAIQLLPPKQAEVFTLSRLEELSYEEIAEKLNISKDTVRNHLIKALSFMRTYFEGRQEDILFLLLVFIKFL